MEQKDNLHGLTLPMQTVKLNRKGKIIKKQGEPVEVLSASYSSLGYPDQAATSEKPKNLVLCFQDS